MVSNLIPASVGAFGVLATQWVTRANSKENAANEAWKALTTNLSDRVDTLNAKVDELEKRQAKTDRELLEHRSKYWQALDYIHAIRAWGHSLLLGHASLPEPKCPDGIKADLFIDAEDTAH